MRKLGAFVLVLIAATLLNIAALAMAADFVHHKIRAAADLRPSLQLLLIAAVLIFPLHRMARKLDASKRMQYLPYLLWGVLDLLGSLSGLYEYVYCAGVSAAAALICWKLPAGVPAAATTPGGPVLSRAPVTVRASRPNAVSPKLALALWSGSERSSLCSTLTRPI